MTDLTTTVDARLPKLGDNPAFVASMATGWGRPDRAVALVPGTAEAALAHRRRLAVAAPGRTFVAVNGQAPVRNGDQRYAFRADSTVLWLTGCDVEGAVVAVRAGTGGDHETTLFLPEPQEAGTVGAFTSVDFGEFWVGPSPTLGDWADALGVTVRPLAEAAERLGSGADGLGDAGGLAALGVAPSDAAARLLSDLRMTKDEWEIGQLTEAVDATVTGFAATIAEVPHAVTGPGERWLQGTFDRHARTHGNGPGYASIVGAGPRSAVLHWVRATGAVTPGEVLLLDLGVEASSGYTADVTRTFPVDGSFTDAQRRVHDLVERAHLAALAVVQPGRVFRDFHEVSMRVLAEGLHDWGLLPVSVDEALSDAGQQHRRYIVCGVGHHLGLDVHDCARSAPEAYQGATIRAGMALTVEPGLYFHEHDLTLPPELRGIGVRIEDDLVVTGSGVVNLSAGLPTSATGLETWMRSQIGG